PLIVCVPWVATNCPSPVFLNFPLCKTLHTYLLTMINGSGTTCCYKLDQKLVWLYRALSNPALPSSCHPRIRRVHFSRAGWFRCPETELEFEVRAAVTIRYGYGSWRQHLTESQQEQWMVAGPLFDIRVEPTEAVAAIHLPHFLYADKSWMHIAHFIDEGMILENPTQVRLFHAVLENPSFSLIGVFWRRESSVQRIPIHSIVLLYQAQKRVNLTLHLYLIPDDGSRVKVIYSVSLMGTHTYPVTV
uniref:FIIND domain-containing protein n=1 Tax=Chrysemys picta bellii TaxID=8478 RepID=A0A8C3HH34_CHRPI